MSHPDDRSGQTLPTLKSIGIAGEAHAVGRIQRLEAEVKRLNGAFSEGKNKEAELLAALRGELDVSNLWPDEAPCASCGGYFGDHAGFDCPPPHKTKFHEATK